MGDWHPDRAVEQALIQLNDALCTWERNTGRKSTLVLIPEAPDEQICISQSGKPLPPNRPVPDEEIMEIVSMALTDRGHN